MKVTFRVDASNQIGSGHLIRCITLANSLVEHGAQVLFICRKHPGNMSNLLLNYGLPFVFLPEASDICMCSADEYSRLRGVTQSVDADQTIKALAGIRSDWIIVDHYGLDAEWERRIRPHSVRLMVIDDLANREHSCDMLLDQNYSDQPALRYVNRVGPSTTLLIGPQYALLHSEYAVRRLTTLPRKGSVKRILIFFGGSDTDNMTGKTLEALSRPPLREIEVDVVIGANSAYRESIETLVAARGLTRLFGPLPHLADLMANADLAVGGGGTTVWERMCLGLPAIVVSIAENQIPISKLLDVHGLIQYIGNADVIEVDDLFTALKSGIDERRYVEHSRLSMSVCDGGGTARIVERLLHPDSEINL